MTLSHSRPAGISPSLPPMDPALATRLQNAGVTTPIAQLFKTGNIGQKCTLTGWIRSFRASKNVAFLALNDGSCINTLQVVLDPQLPSLQACLSQLTTGASVRIEGVLQSSPASGQSVECVADTLQVLGAADPTTYPLQKKGHTLEFLRGISHLRSRSNTFGAVFRIRSLLAQATHLFFAAQDFRYVHTPILTASDCEGAGEMFEVQARGKKDAFFGRPTMLTVSGQLNGESLAYGLGRIYTFGPTFRAENSNTVRHLSEFWMIEPEMAFFDLPANMVLAEGYLQYVVQAALQQCAEDIAFLAKHYDKTLPEQLEKIAQEPFEHVTYTDAVQLLTQSKQSFEYDVGWGKDLQAEHERWLVEKYFKKPVIVTDYPKALKAFYMFQNADDKTVAAMDILVPRIGEIIGGSQREHRTTLLQQRMQQAGLDLAAYQWYLDLNHYGAVPHAGFGLGFERLVMLCTGMTNIRDTIPFPRAPGLVPF